MDEIFQFFENPVYELRCGVHVPDRNSRTVFCATESIINQGPKLWNMIPENIKSSESLNVFKSKMKYWDTKSLSVPNLQNLHWPRCFYKLSFCFC